MVEAAQPAPRAASTSTIERAHELARSGTCRTIDDIRRQLDRENYPAVSSHLSGPLIRLQLRQLCRDHAAASRHVATGD